jgi:hypothetical protein
MRECRKSEAVRSTENCTVVKSYCARRLSRATRATRKFLQYRSE